MKRIYDENKLPTLKKQRNKYIVITISLFVLGVVSALFVYIFTNRQNIVLMEVLFAILLFLFLSMSTFIGLTILRKTILRMKLIQSFSLVNTKKNEVNGVVEYLEERRKYYSFEFIKIKVNDNYFFVEEGIELPNNAKLIIKKGFVVSYE